LLLLYIVADAAACASSLWWCRRDRVWVPVLVGGCRCAASPASDTSPWSRYCLVFAPSFLGGRLVLPVGVDRPCSVAADVPGCCSMWCCEGIECTSLAVPACAAQCVWQLTQQRTMLATQCASPLPTVAGDLSREGQNLWPSVPCSLMLHVSERDCSVCVLSWSVWPCGFSLHLIGGCGRAVCLTLCT
jgi:hypothetical protein